ncbi:TerD family protein [Nocardia sp. NPDC050697]|uniref:TerD family protein n=1 Tax=Nocardia sp. NPDC050697 TaxID=3155158 RepID=UPI0033F1322F
MKKGANVAVPTSVLRIEVSAAPDVAALLVTGGRVRTDADFVFFNQPAHPSGAVHYEREHMLVADLSRIEDGVDAVVIAVAGDEELGALGARVLESTTGAEVAAFECRGEGENALVVGELYRRGGGWRFRAVGQGYTSGLEGLVVAHGVSVDEEVPESAERAGEAGAGPGAGSAPGARNSADPGRGPTPDQQYPVGDLGTPQPFSAPAGSAPTHPNPTLVNPNSRGAGSQPTPVDPNSRGTRPQSTQVNPNSRGAGPQSTQVNSNSRGAGSQPTQINPNSRGAGPQPTWTDPNSRGHAPHPTVVNPRASAPVAVTEELPTLSLTSVGATSGLLRINLSWSIPAIRGIAGRGAPDRPLDLDLCCLWQLNDGSKGIVHALGEFGSLSGPPFLKLDTDDRTGRPDGENLLIDLDHTRDFRRILVFASVYEGADDFRGVTATATLHPVHGAPIELSVAGCTDNSRKVALAMLENVAGDLVLRREGRFIPPPTRPPFFLNMAVDEAYNWGLAWVSAPAKE